MALLILLRYTPTKKDYFLFPAWGEYRIIIHGKLSVRAYVFFYVQSRTPFCNYVFIMSYVKAFHCNRIFDSLRTLIIQRL